MPPDQWNVAIAYPSGDVNRSRLVKGRLGCSFAALAVYVFLYVIPTVARLWPELEDKSQGLSMFIVVGVMVGLVGFALGSLIDKTNRNGDE